MVADCAAPIQGAPYLALACMRAPCWPACRRPACNFALLFLIHYNWPMHVGGCQHACTCMHAGNAHACMHANMGLYMVFLIKSRITHILNSENIYTWTQFNHLNLIQLFETQKIIYIELNKEIHNFNRPRSRFYFISRWSNKAEALIPIVRSKF